MKKENENARWNNHDKNKNSVKNFGVVGHWNFGYPFNRKSFVKLLVPGCQGLSVKSSRRHLIHYCFCEMDVFRQGGQCSFKYLKKLNLSLKGDQCYLKFFFGEESCLKERALIWMLSLLSRSNYQLADASETFGELIFKFCRSFLVKI